ncbi:MAG: Gfo/Idh/MocA family oxidoreductase [Crocinitomicaceae bacterium]|nr:Gfo/Idh/MocA family oxidoreductase [Crocinitomicaceae bacterium]
MKILFVGFGSIAKKHLQALREIRDDLEVYALRSTKTSPPVDGVTSLYQVSEIPTGLAFAIISNATSAHAGTLLIVSQLRCPIFIEKPVFHELSKGNQVLAQQIKSVGIKTYVGCNLRFHPLMKAFKDLVFNNRSKVEEVNVYAGSYLPEWRPGVDYRNSYSAQRELGGGVDLDLIHEIDYITWFFGFPYKAYALKNSHSSLNIDSPDAAYYILHYTNFVATVTLNYFRKLPKRTFEVVLSDHIFELDLFNSKIYRDGQEIISGHKNDMMTSYVHQMKYFIDGIESESSFENDIENGLKVLEICLVDEIK